MYSTQVARYRYPIVGVIEFKDPRTRILPVCHSQKNSERDTIQYTIYSYTCFVELDSTSLVTVTQESSSTEMSGTKYPPQNLPIRRGGEDSSAAP